VKILGSHAWTVYKGISSEATIGGNWLHPKHATKWNANQINAAVILLGTNPTGDDKR
jgi:hypothetical protein